MNHLETGNAGTFYFEIAGKKVAEMTYSHPKPNMIIIEHTEVDESLKGQGVGYKLIEQAISFARKNNLKVEATCTYAKAILTKKHEEFKDVL